MVEVFTRAEWDFWINYLGNDPGELASKIATFRASGEPITVNEVRRSFSIFGTPFPDHPDDAVGNNLLDGSTPDDPNGQEYKALLLQRAQFAVGIIEQNAAGSMGDPKYQKLRDLLAPS